MAKFTDAYIDGLVQDCSIFIADTGDTAVLHSAIDMHYSAQITRLILGLCPANERCRYKVTLSLIGWAQTWNQPWMS